jgi:hypothetical protein
MKLKITSIIALAAVAFFYEPYFAKLGQFDLLFLLVLGFSMAAYDLYLSNKES